MSAPTGVLAGDGLVSGVLMATMAMGSVGLWTLRVTFAARGRKLLGAAVAAVEAVVFAMAFSNLAASLDAPVRVIGYALGVAVGTVLGLYLDERTSRGTSEIRSSMKTTAGLVGGLRSQPWPSASFPAEGPRVSVTVAVLGVDDAEFLQVVDSLQESVPEAFWVVQQLPACTSARLGRFDARRCARSGCVGHPATPLGPCQLNQNTEDSHDHHSRDLAAEDRSA